MDFADLLDVEIISKCYLGSGKLCVQVPLISISNQQSLAMVCQVEGKFAMRQPLDNMR